MSDQPETTGKVFEMTTTAQVERTYVVRGQDDEQAHQRLRAFIKDPDALRPDLVVEQKEQQKDTTPQKVNGKKDITPTLGKPPAAASAGGGKQPTK